MKGEIRVEAYEEEPEAQLLTAYDETSMESVVLHGGEEEEDLDPAEAAFMRGFLDIGEV